MMEKAAALIRAGDGEGLRQMIARGGLSGLQGAEKGVLPRLAASLGRADLLRLLCERCHAVALDADENGRDALHAACASGNRDTVAFAVETLGMNPLRGDKNGVTPFDLAAAAPDQGGYRYLVERLGFGPEEGFRNPVRRGCYPDPSVVRVGDDYYMVNSSFVLFPCLPVSHSPALVHWETVGHAVSRLDWARISGLPGGYGYWAPDISFHKGKFWVVATLRLPQAPFRCQMITCAENPEGPWREPRFLPLDGIDPSLFTDDDGRRYILLNPGARLAEIDEDGNVPGEPEMIYFGSSRIKSEGPHLLRRDGWYYLFQAEGGTGNGHTETVARSRSLRGPYTPCPFNPILQSRDGFIRRAGHGKPFQTKDGAWYMLYLCARPVDGETLMGRETALDPLTWTTDGWPMVNGLNGPSCLQKRPALPLFLPPEPPDDPQDLRSGWVSPGEDPRSFARLENGSLCLAGTDGKMRVLAKRQEEAAFRQTGLLDASGLRPDGVAGLTGYYDERSFYLFGLKRTAGEWQIVCHSPAVRFRPKR